MQIAERSRAWSVTYLYVRLGLDYGGMEMEIDKWLKMIHEIYRDLHWFKNSGYQIELD